jgi:hypothetical protein
MMTQSNQSNPANSVISLSLPAVSMSSVAAVSGACQEMSRLLMEACEKSLEHDSNCACEGSGVLLMERKAKVCFPKKLRDGQVVELSGPGEQSMQVRVRISDPSNTTSAILSDAILTMCH